MHQIFKNVDVGIVHPMLFPGVQSGEGPICNTARIIVEDPYFTCIEVSRVKDKKTRKELSHLLRMGVMRVVYTQGPAAYANRLDIHSLEKNKRKESVEQTKRLIDEAYTLGASIFQMIGGPDPGPDKRDDAKKYLINSLCELSEYVSGSNKEMVITLENLDRNVHKRFLIGPTVEAAQVIREVRKTCPNVGLTLDLAHLPLLGEMFEEAVAISKDVVCHVHLGNCIIKDPDHPRYGDTHPPWGIEGGEIGTDELACFLQQLQKAGFLEQKESQRNIISIEVVPEPKDIPEILIASSKRILFQAFTRAGMP